LAPPGVEPEIIRLLTSYKPCPLGKTCLSNNFAIVSLLHIRSQQTDGLYCTPYRFDIDYQYFSQSGSKSMLRESFKKSSSAVPGRTRDGGRASDGRVVRPAYIPRNVCQLTCHHTGKRTNRAWTSHARTTNFDARVSIGIQLH